MPANNLHYAAQGPSSASTEISKERMSKLRAKSKRNGSWFRALTGVERGIVNLTLRCVQTIRSGTLSLVLQRILEKLSTAVEHPFAWRLEQVGRPLAEKISHAAMALGIAAAEKWEHDLAYIHCLGLNYMSRTGLRTAKIP